MTLSPGTDEPAAVVAARARLAAVPGEYLTGALAETVLAQARMQVVVDALGADLTAAETEAQDALAAVAAGDASEAARGHLVAALGARAAVAAAQGLVRAPELDRGAVQQALTAAVQMGGGASHRRVEDVVPLDYDTEVDVWVHLYRHREPPVPTDLDRQASEVRRNTLELLREAEGGWQRWARSCLDWSTSPAPQDPFALLAEGPVWTQKVETVAALVEQTNATVSAANEARAAAGLTWVRPAA